MSQYHDTSPAGPGANRQDPGAAPPRRRERGRGRQEHEHHHASDAPAIRFAFGLALISIVSVAYVQWFGSPPEPKTLSPIVQERMLSVSDLPGGLVEVRDAESGHLITRYDLGEGAFVRTSLRSLADARHRVAPGDESPFRLELRESGSLRLIDPITDQTLELWAFGHSNALAFQELLPQDTESQRAVDGAPTVAQEATRSHTDER